MYIVAVMIVAVIVVAVFLSVGYVKSPPNTATIISGPGKQPRVLIGKAGFKIPFLERAEYDQDNPGSFTDCFNPYESYKKSFHSDVPRGSFSA